VLEKFSMRALIGQIPTIKSYMIYGTEKTQTMSQEFGNI
jgi:hypothetical protein